MANRTASGTKGNKRVAEQQGKQERSRGKGSPKNDQAIEIVASKLSYDGPLFQVFTDQIRSDGQEFRRDVIRHSGSAVILAIDDGGKKDPLVVMERQYRHAAGQSLLEVPAGKLEKGEDPLEGAKRELLEETGFKAKRWKKLVRYFASPGFLAEWMQVFLAEGLIAGETDPDEDEQIEVQMIPLSELLLMIEKGKIHDGKTLISVMLYDRLRSQRKKSAAKEA
jgi:ADP-ribose pyrophosphatase